MSSDYTAPFLLHQFLQVFIFSPLYDYSNCPSQCCQSNVYFFKYKFFLYKSNMLMIIHIFKTLRMSPFWIKSRQFISVHSRPFMTTCLLPSWFMCYHWPKSFLNFLQTENEVICSCTGIFLLPGRPLSSTPST